MSTSLQCIQSTLHNNCNTLFAFCLKGNQAKYFLKLEKFLFLWTVLNDFFATSCRRLYCRNTSVVLLHFIWYFIEYLNMTNASGSSCFQVWSTLPCLLCSRNLSIVLTFKKLPTGNFLIHIINHFLGTKIFHPSLYGHYHHCFPDILFSFLCFSSCIYVILH